MKHTKNYTGYVNSDIITDLQKQNADLLEALKDCIIDVIKRCEDLGLDHKKYSTWIKAEQAIKSNEK